MPSIYIVNPTKFIAISDLSFHLKLTYSHPKVAGTAIYKFNGYMFAAVNIIDVMMTIELNVLTKEILSIVFSLLLLIYTITH